MSHSPLGFRPQEPIAQYELGPAQNFVYLLLDWSTKEAAIVDPQKDLTKIFHDLEAHGFRLTAILLTHSHWDHTAGVVPLLKRDSNLIIRVGKKELHRLPESVLDAGGMRVLTKDETFRVGTIEVNAFHTPGHSAGAFSYFVGVQPGVERPYLFTGDTIFIQDCGRTDLETGSDTEMFDSIQRMKTFPKESILLVGHHYAPECVTTLENEMKHSPPFQCKNLEELASLP